MKRERGVTLLELLISISLVSLLSLGVMYSLRVGIDALGKVNDRFMKNRRVLGAEKALAQMLHGMMPATVECGNQPGGPKSVMFQGDPQAMRFVSSYSLNEGARGYPKLVEFTVIPGEKEGFRMIVNEVPYSSTLSLRGLCVGISNDPSTGQPSPLFPPVGPRPDSFILADRLAGVQFFYRETLPAPLFERWHTKWLYSKMPSAVRIQMLPLEQTPANLQTSSVTIPIRITANPLYAHTD